jgi:peptide-methionine (S)-S-oxide reductase
MLPSLYRLACVLAVLVALVVPAGANTTLPAPAVDTAPSAKSGPQTAVFAGGCFWGVEAVFRHVNGVSRAVSGYSGGKAKNPTYGMVSSGLTGHAEAVQVTFDPAKVSYGQLLRVFFSVAHDPTELNRQGPDVGTQYRSAIFYANDEQKRVAEAYVAQLGAAKAFRSPIVTQVAALDTFYPAEAYHQNYLALHPTEPYIVYNDLPKLEALKKQFPGLYVAAK